MRDKFQEAGTTKYSWKPMRVVMLCSGEELHKIS